MEVALGYRGFEVAAGYRDCVGVGEGAEDGRDERLRP